MNASKRSGLEELKDNLLSLKSSFISSFLRHGKPISDRSRAAIIVNNFFFHIHSARTHINTLRPTYTFGLGLITLNLLLIASVSGILLMIYYHPSVEMAYSSVKDISYVVFGGRLLRNIHKWSSEGMIIAVIFHMARVLFTGSYKQDRGFNWVIGVVLFCLTLVLNLSGYILTWDQLAYWAMVIVANIIQSPKEVTDILGITAYFDIGGLQKEIFLGGITPGEETLIRIYLLHIVLFPLVLFILLGVHFWRIRKDGGLTVPENFEPTKDETGSLSAPEKKKGVLSAGKTYGLMALTRDKTPAADKDVENTVMSWPHLLRAEVAVFMLCLAAVVAFSFFVDAPLREPANALIPENPARAPWYFLGLQELVSYSAFMGGIGIPTLAIVGLILIPYLDRDQQHVGIWFSNRQGWLVALTSFIVGVVVLIGILAFVVNFGWFRSWWPDIPQLAIMLINPGTIWVGFTAMWTTLVIKKTDSTRMGIIAFFTLFLLSFAIFTYMGTYLRGPNWEFYWSKSQWPIH